MMFTLKKFIFKYTDTHLVFYHLFLSAICPPACCVQHSRPVGVDPTPEGAGVLL